mgnify:CR=1 FL=1
MATRGRKTKHLGVWLTATVAAAVVVGYLYWAGRESWRLTGGTALGVHGWVAMSLGLIGTALLAGVLMWLAFYSARKGYDERAGGEDD